MKSESSFSPGTPAALLLPKTEICPTDDAMGLRCADMIRDCIVRKPDALICLPAGNTVIGTCQALIRMVQSGELDISRVRFVSLDEWVGLSGEAAREDCTHFLYQHFYGPLNIPKDRLFLFDPNAEDLQAECRRIDDVIFQNGGVDFMLLGLGMNGHLGLNEPGADFHQYSHVTYLSDVTKSVGQKYFSRETALSGGITLGIQHMFDAREVVLQICGSHKQDIVHALYTTPATTDLPGTVFQLLPNGRIIMDEAAAEKVRNLL